MKETVLEITEEAVSVGEPIQSKVVEIPNPSICLGLKPLGRGLTWMLESNSNNMSGVMQPSDIKEFWRVWNYHKDILNHKLESSEEQMPLDEIVPKMDLPKSIEIGNSFLNQHWGLVATEVYFYIYKVKGLRSSKGTGVVSQEDRNKIKKLQASLEKFVNALIDDGSSPSNVGIIPPDFSKLGSIKLNQDVNYLRHQSPDKKAVSAARTEDGG